MKTEILQAIQDWLGPIRKQMEANQKTTYQQMITTATSRGGLTGSQIQTLTGKLTGGVTLDPDRIREDMQIRGLLTRIKYARINRGQRDSLCGMVRSLAVEGRLDGKNATQVYKMIALMETMSGAKNDDKFSAFGNKERTVDDEMKLISDRRAAKTASTNRLQTLQSTFNALA